MDFELTEEQLMFRDMAHKFAEQEMLPRLREHEVAGKYQHELIAKAAKVGLVAPHISQEYGGLGLDYLTTSLIFEELCWASYSTAHNFLGGPIQPGSIIDKMGTPEQKQKWLPPMCRGELFLAGAAVEPGAGSDATNIETTAVKSGNKWVINGTKVFICDGGVANVVLVLAQTDKSKGPRGISVFAVERGTPGFSSADIKTMLTWRAANWATLRFSDCEVPLENQVGEIGRGLRTMFSGIQVARLMVIMGCVGMSRSCMESVIKYTKERKAFGRPLGGFQLVQGIIADISSQIEAVRLLCYKYAMLMDKNAPERILAGAHAKYLAMRLVKFATSESVRLFGAYGLIDEYPVEHHYRDALTTTLMGGTPEMMALTIGRELFDIDAMRG
jgi:alkylation response protein AidB-like acyl-CoA dehydrogenase